VGREAWSERIVASGQWPVNAKRGDRAAGEKRQNKAILLNETTRGYYPGKEVPHAAAY
jgi:hypothetical protein